MELRGFWCGTEGFLMWDYVVFGVERRGFWCGTKRCVELRDFWCGTKGFFGLKRSCPFVWN